MSTYGLLEDFFQFLSDYILKSYVAFSSQFQKQIRHQYEVKVKHID